MLAYGYSPNLTKNGEKTVESDTGEITDYWLKLLLSDYEDDTEYSSKRETFLFHELFVWAPRFVEGIEVVFPGSGTDVSILFFIISEILLLSCLKFIFTCIKILHAHALTYQHPGTLPHTLSHTSFHARTHSNQPFLFLTLTLTPTLHHITSQAMESNDL